VEEPKGDTQIPVRSVDTANSKAEVARYGRSYEQGIWLPPPIMRPEPPAPSRPALIAAVAIAPPELREYADLCA
jgi:hypothetical protein